MHAYLCVPQIRVPARCTFVWVHLFVHVRGLGLRRGLPARRPRCQREPPGVAAAPGWGRCGCPGRGAGGAGSGVAGQRERKKEGRKKGRLRWVSQGFPCRLHLPRGSPSQCLKTPWTLLELRFQEATAADCAEGRCAQRQGERNLRHLKHRSSVLCRKSSFDGRVAEHCSSLAKEAAEPPIQKPPACDPGSMLWVNLL